MSQFIHSAFSFHTSSFHNEVVWLKQIGEPFWRARLENQIRLEMKEDENEETVKKSQILGSINVNPPWS